MNAIRFQVRACVLVCAANMQVLAMAGFGADEAHSIFAQVDTDGGGSVDLEEFEAWWIESQRQHVSLRQGWVVCLFRTCSARMK